MAVPEQPKKPAGGGYGFYLSENRETFQKAVPAGSTVTAVSKLAGERWRALSASEKAPYEKKFKDAQAKYEKDMKAFLDAGGEKKGRKRKGGKEKKAKDPNMPKRPVGGAYGSFLEEKRPEFTEACKGQKASAISKMAGEKWKTLSDADKAKYEAKYQEKKRKYDAEMAEYRAKSGGGDGDEEEDEEA